MRCSNDYDSPQSHCPGQADDFPKVFYLLRIQAHLHCLQCFSLFVTLSSYVQCKLLHVWSVYFSHFLAKIIFFRGVWGVYKMIVEIPEGWEGYFSGQKFEIPGRRGGGGLREIPSVVGVWIFSGTTHWKFQVS